MKKFATLAFTLGLAAAACKSSSGTNQSNIENESMTLEGAFEQVGDVRMHIVFSKNGTFWATYGSDRIDGKYTATHTLQGPAITLSKQKESDVVEDTPIVDAGKDTGTTPAGDAGKSDAGIKDAGAGGVVDAGKVADAAAPKADAGAITVDPGQTNGDEVFGALKLGTYEFLRTGKHNVLVLRNDNGTRQFKPLPSYCIANTECSTQGLSPCSAGFQCLNHVCACGKATGDAGK